MREKWKKLLAEYGKIAMVVYFFIFFIFMLSFSIAIHFFDFKIEGVPEGVSIIGGAWIMTKLLQVVRILLTLSLTPVVSYWVKKIKMKTNRIS